MTPSLRTHRYAGAALAVALALAATASNAQPRPNNDHRGPPAHAHQPAHKPAQKHAERALHPPGHGGAKAAHAHRGRGAGPEHAFHKGGRLPSHYRSPQYVVNDWRGHHLAAPPRGHHWVQTGSDYVLVAVATGVIAQIVLH